MRQFIEHQINLVLIALLISVPVAIAVYLFERYWTKR